LALIQFHYLVLFGMDVDCSLFVLEVAVDNEAIDEGDVLYAHVGRSCSLCLCVCVCMSLSLATTIRLFSRLLSVCLSLSLSPGASSRSSSTYTRRRRRRRRRRGRRRRRCWRRRWRRKAFPLFLFARHERSKKKEKKCERRRRRRKKKERERRAEKDIDEQYSSHSRLVKSVVRFLLLTDTQRAIKFRDCAMNDTESLNRCFRQCSILVRSIAPLGRDLLTM
jgi:hypothetical protein